MWNMALAGTASENLLSLIENAYGYPESKDSILCGQFLETVEWDFMENEPDDRYRVPKYSLIQC